MSEEYVASPCVSICALNERDICEGCFRSLEEIGNWQRLSAEAKREVLTLCERRRRASGWVL